MKRRLLLFALLLLISGAMYAEEEFTITVSANPSNGGTVSGGGTYNQGQSCTVTATPNTGFTFTNWTENDSVVSTEADYQFIVSSDRTLVANFQEQPQQYTITVSANPSNGGTVSGGGTYNQGQSCTLTATPANGYAFVKWTKNGTQVSTNATYTFTVTESAAYVAHFQLQQYTITATANPANGGSVSGGGTYNYGQSCTLTATPVSGYSFVKWTKNGIQVSTSATYTFTVTESAAYVAHFQVQQYTITVTANPTNGGSVSGGGTYNYGQSCTLTATPAYGYAFVKWTKNGTQVSTSATYTFTVTESAAYVAHFTQQEYVITAIPDPEEGGEVEGGGGYNYGESCTLTATPANGYSFVKWTKNGIQVSTSATYTFTVTESADYVAHFQVQQYTITATANPTYGGSVSGGGTYNYGQSCTLTATPANGYSFVKWTKNGIQVSTSATYTFTVTESAAYVAHFTQQQYTINVSASPNNGGSVYVGNNPNATQGTYTYGQSCTVHALPSSDYVFINWTENGIQVSMSANYTFTVTGSRNLVAHFKRQYIINVSANPIDGGTVTGGGTYTQGETCMVSATASEGYAFINWTENNNVVSTDANYEFIVSANRNLVANFEELAPDTYYINVSSNPSDGGSVSGGGIYNAGVVCTVTATPNFGYTFANWTENGAVVSTDADYQFIVNGNRTLVANFQAKSFTITLLAEPINGGSVYGEGTFNYGDTCTIKAIANEDFTFNKWTEENGIQVTTEPVFQFKVTDDRTLVAHFQAETQIYTISVSANPIEGGTVVGGGTYIEGLDCTVKATPNSGYTFANWTENDIVVSQEEEYTFRVDGNRLLVANFTSIQQYTIIVNSNNDDWGTVSGGGQYYSGVTCKLHAMPNNGYRFDNWKNNGVVVSDEPDFSFTVTRDATYTAFFSELPIEHYTISTEVAPVGAGTVSGGGQYTAGSTIELTAIPNLGFSFIHWQDGNTDNPRTITVTGDATYTATFTQDSYVITTNVSPDGAGSVEGGGTYFYHEQITLTATANMGYVFDHWDDGNTDNPRYVTVSCDMEYVAIFKEVTCIENLQEIEAKEHTVGNDTYDLILVYPNPNNEDYKYQWCYSEDGENYSDLKEGTYNKQYYYKGGRLKEGYYKVRVSKNECSEKTEPYHVSGSHLRIYPNPSRRGNEIIVMNDCDGQAQLTIYTTDGRVLHTQTVTDSQAIIDISLPQGVYVAYLTDSNGYTKVGKLIIQ